MKDKIFGVLQRVGRSFMLPIAILPVAGLFLGVGGSFTNETMLETYGLMGLMGPGTFINAILQVLNAAGSVVFDNLPLIFAIGVAIGMAKQEKEVSALSAIIAFFVMHATIGAMTGDYTTAFTRFSFRRCSAFSAARASCRLSQRRSTWWWASQCTISGR